MSRNLFEVYNLSCSYSKNIEEKVLYIDHLSIQAGKLIFLLGASGSGKSTLLEVLALMNDTIAEGDIHFSPKSEEKPVSYQNLWGKKSQEALAAIRKQHFSFIFQDTNLMENFTAYENVCLSRMIQKNSNHHEAALNVSSLMGKVGLGEVEVRPDTMAVNLSGGQRQRLAFVRALNVDHTVLFGDEPTGNLDDRMAEGLFEIIRNNLQSHQSAIIVTHNIELALQFADQIFVITKKSGESFGAIEAENIYKRSDWESQPESFREKVESLYQESSGFGDAGATESIVTTWVAKESGQDTTFQKLFLKRESMALSGRWLQNLLILMAMLWFTFLAIGFANGGLDYLRTKLNNPVVNWLEIDVPHAVIAKFDEIRSQLESLVEEGNPYNLEGVVAYSNIGLEFADYESYEMGVVQSYLKIGRSVEVNDIETTGLLSDVLAEKNLLVGTGEGFSNNYEFSLIVTQELLRGLNYDPNAPFILMNVDDPFISGQEHFLKIPIKAVVREIPGKNDFIVTTCFLNAYMEIDDWHTFDILQYRDIDLFFEGSQETGNILKRKIEEFFRNNEDLQSRYQPFVELREKYMACHIPGYRIHIDLENVIPDSAVIVTLDALFRQMVDAMAIQPFKEKIHRIYDLRYGESCTISNPDKLSIYFLNLDHVRKFASDLVYNFNEDKSQEFIRVDTAKVQEKENFNFLSKITKIIAWLLVLFSVISISLFASNLLKMHLSKVGMNIGTFKAFGLSNGKALFIYFQIILYFLFAGLLFGGLLALATGTILDELLIQQFKVEQGVTYFKLFSPMTLWAIVIIFVTTLLVSWWTIRNMLAKSPGDLIYNR